MTQTLDISLCARPDLSDWQPLVVNALLECGQGFMQVAVQPANALNFLHKSALPNLVLYLGAMPDDQAMLLNSLCHAKKVPLLLAQPAINGFRLGPAVLQGKLPCLQCYREFNRFLPFNGYAFDESLAAHQADASFSRQFTSALAHAVMGFFQDAHSTLRQGKLLYFGANFGTNGYALNEDAFQPGAPGVATIW